MAKHLVIVESPAKAGTIAKYLGSDYAVEASFGHVRDLPASKLGVDPEARFIPTYVIPPKAKKAVKALKDALKGKEAVLLATDLDREGEAIAWHVSQVLDLPSLSASGKLRVDRITFDEITPTALKEALQTPRALDDHLIDAQQARRVLDRLVGYSLSPILWKKVQRGLSAGRVQSVALRLIVEREEERERFKAVEYWSLEATVSEQGSTTTFPAKLIRYRGEKVDGQQIGTQAQAEVILAALLGADYQVTAVDQKRVNRKPPAPYTTSTFQQDAVNRLRLSAKNAMRIAQQLYEAGHITYMRTDSVDLASSAVAAIRSHLVSQYGAKAVPAKPPVYRSGTKRAQEAHEAIRPSDPNRLPEQIAGEANLRAVYDLIRRRTLASQMQPALVEQTTVTIGAGEGTFVANGQVVREPGFYRVWPPESKDDAVLPELSAGTSLQLRELKPTQHFTEPPPRFTEASLIKALEEQGIGRPSTYAPTIDTLIQRRYVTLEQRRFAPEKIGRLVTQLLKEHFPEIVDTGFTASMEAQLDRVASGEALYEGVLQEFWEPFHAKVESSKDSIARVDTSEPSDQICPTCGAPMIYKYGRYGRFLSCSKFPECKTAMPAAAPAVSGLICPVCGKPLAARRARRGLFFGCSGYPSCTFAVWKKEALPKKIADLEAEGVALPFKEQSLAALAALPAPAAAETEASDTQTASTT